MPVSGRSAAAGRRRRGRGRTRAAPSRAGTRSGDLPSTRASSRQPSSATTCSSGGGSSPQRLVPRQEGVAPLRRSRSRVARAAHALQHEVREQERDVEGGVAAVRDLEVEREHVVRVDEQVLRRPVAEHEAAARRQQPLDLRFDHPGDVRVRRGGGAVVRIDATLQQGRLVGEVAGHVGVAGRTRVDLARAARRHARAACRSMSAARAARPSSSRRHPPRGSWRTGTASSSCASTTGTDTARQDLRRGSSSARRSLMIRARSKRQSAATRSFGSDCFSTARPPGQLAASTMLEMPPDRARASTATPSGTTPSRRRTSPAVASVVSVSGSLTGVITTGPAGGPPGSRSARWCGRAGPGG